MQEQWRRSGKRRRDRMSLSLPPKLVEKLVFSFVKFSFSFQVTRLMSYYAETGHSRLSILIVNTCANFPKQMHFLEWSLYRRALLGFSYPKLGPK